MVVYGNEVETKENKNKITWDKKLTTTYTSACTVCHFISFVLDSQFDCQF